MRVAIISLAEYGNKQMGAWREEHLNRTGELLQSTTGLSAEKSYNIYQPVDVLDTSSCYEHQELCFGIENAK